MTSNVIGSINGDVVICPICISLDFGRLVHAYLLCVNSHALFALFDLHQILNSYDVHEIQIHIDMHILKWFYPMFCSHANYFGPNKFGDHIVLKKF